MLLASALACATTGASLRGERYVNQAKAYSIATPGAAWTQTHLANIDLVLRGPSRETLSLASRCRETVAGPRTLARHLRFELGAHALLEEGPEESEQGSAWGQTLQSGQVRVKTVTLVRGTCVYDFTLAAKQGFEEAETIFDLWWRSFRPGVPR